MTTTIVIVRHAETVDNVEDRIAGSLHDSDLTARGKEQARKLRETLSSMKFDRVYSSPQGRALKTAELIKPDGLEITVHENLHERGFGEIDGNAWKHIDKTMPGLQEKYRETGELIGVKGAESFDECRERMLSAMSSIAEINKGKRILLISHGTVLRIFLAAVIGIKGRSKEDLFKVNVDNCSVNTVVYEKEEFKVSNLNVNKTLN